MIFVTVGSMLPFERLIKAMDQWASQNSEPVLAQIGDGRFLPSHMRWVRSLDRDDYRRSVDESRVIVAHAGIGTYLTALEQKRPLIVLPRQALFGEHTNDHQLHTVGWLSKKPGVQIAADEHDLPTVIAKSDGCQVSRPDFIPVAPKELTERVRKFIVEP